MPPFLSAYIWKYDVYMGEMTRTLRYCLAWAHPAPCHPSHAGAEVSIPKSSCPESRSLMLWMGPPVARIDA